MKNYFLYLAAVTLLFACSKNDFEYDNYHNRLGVYEKTGEGREDFQVNLDDGDVVIPTEISGNIGEYNDGDRVIVYYSWLSDGSDLDNDSVIHSAVHGIDKVLTKDVITLTEEISDSIGNNTIHVHEKDIWISNNFLNIYFSYYGRDQVHYLNMIKYPNDSLDADGRLVMEFRHNNNGDSFSYPYDGLVSFDMNSLYKQGIDSLSIAVKVDDFYDGSFIWTDTYYFNQMSESSKRIEFQNSSEFIR